MGFSHDFYHMITMWLSHDCHVTVLYDPMPVPIRDIAIYVGQVYGLKWGAHRLSTWRLHWKADSKPTLHIYCQGCDIVCPWRCVLTWVVMATVSVIYVSPLSPVGASISQSDTSELKFLYEGHEDFSVIPSYAVIPAQVPHLPSFPPLFLSFLPPFEHPHFEHTSPPFTHFFLSPSTLPPCLS